MALPQHLQVSHELPVPTDWAVDLCKRYMALIESRESSSTGVVLRWDAHGWRVGRATSIELKTDSSC